MNGSIRQFFRSVRTTARRLPARLAAIVLLAVCSSPGQEPPPSSTPRVDFAREIEPILSRNCLDCHGPVKSEAGLRIDLKDGVFQGGDHGAAILPGRSSDSLLIQAITGTHAEIPRMPRKRDPLSESEIALLRSWIDQGADWPAPDVEAAGGARSAHWAFQPVQSPPAPGVRTPERVRNPIDAFVLARLEQEGLAFSPEADRVTLIRRLSLDLLGLPPSPEEVDEFVADAAPGAYERLVDRLLQSPHYGERWGRRWLDAARYADSNGFEKDRTRGIWPWRDWVIDAFNRDLPFDRFTIEQLAGDLLPDADLRDRVATGFLRNSMINMEGGVEPEKFRTEAIIDRVDAVGRTWLGLTIACAQCHNHKYDPISQKEYYEFFAFLNNDDEARIEVPTPGQEARRNELLNQIHQIEDRLMNDVELGKQTRVWEQAMAGVRDSWTVIDANEWHSQPMKFEKQEDGSLLAGGDIYPDGVLRIWWDTPVTNLTGFRLEALNDANLPFNGPGLDGNGSFLLAEFMVEASPLSELNVPEAGATNFTATTNRIVFRSADADASVAGYGITNAIDGVTTNAGWATDLGPGRRNEERRAVFGIGEPFGYAGGTRYLITLHSKVKDPKIHEGKVSNQIIGRVRLSYTADEGPLRADPLSGSLRSILAKATGDRSAAEQRQLFRAFLRTTGNPACEEIDALWARWPAADTTTLVLSRRPVPRNTRIFRRGDWLRPTAAVTAGTPAVLPPFQETAPRNRLGLAQWLVDRRNPLTARVVMNRIWQEYFGQGLVLTSEDFGLRAEPPSHPALLDWLALEFMDRGWSLKAMHRLIVNSSTYRQSSRITAPMLDRDPYNRLLSRGARVRVESEIVQDIALKSAGLLSPKIGGPSVFPPLPDGVMQLAYGPIPWNVSEGDDRYRRGMYTFWKRSVPYPALVTFDAPSAEQSCVRRARSNTPLQALITLNEPTFNNAARWMAWRLLNERGLTNDEARIIRAFRLVLSRLPEAEETASLARLLASARAEFESNPPDAARFAYADPKNPAPLPSNASLAQLAALTTVTRAILNLDETITRE